MNDALMAPIGTDPGSGPGSSFEGESGTVEPVVAIIPAAGWGHRLGDSVSGSKEVAEIGGEPVCVHLLRRLALAGIDQGVVVLRDGKWDIPQTLLGYRSVGVDLAYVVVDETPSELHSVAAGLPFTSGRLVALGYPDILFEPKDAYSALIESQRNTAADLVLGLFPTDRPEDVDMVALDDLQRPVEVIIKQPDRGLLYSWSIAVWTPRFSAYLTDAVARIESGQADTAAKAPQELSMGDVVQAAIGDSLAIEAVVFEQGGFLDVGTPDDLAEARRLQA